MVHAHQSALEKMFNKTNPEERLEITIDEFDTKHHISTYFLKYNRDFNIEEIPHAENKNIAVAAASIIARYMYDQWFVSFEKDTGIKLPKGGDKIEEKILHELYVKGLLEEAVKTTFPQIKEFSASKSAH